MDSSIAPEREFLMTKFRTALACLTAALAIGSAPTLSAQDHANHPAPGVRPPSAFVTPDQPPTLQPVAARIPNGCCIKKDSCCPTKFCCQKK